jgi:drug/metabolite transporter (DMT)-like permease
VSLQYILIAFLSAILFGASTPVGKLLLESIPPFQLAGLLYLGAALGVLPMVFRKSNKIKISSISRKNKIRLLGAVIFGGVAGPVLLLFGLNIASAGSVAMWLNLELVATAVLGFLFFKDHLGAYGWLGVGGTIAASVLLSWNEGNIGLYALLLVAGASLCWGLDNHLTALIDGITPSQSTFWKGLVAGSTNIVFSIILEEYNRGVGIIAAALIVGIFAYGLSIVFYIISAQNLGATRGQMIFSSAPFFGVVLSVFLLKESVSLLQGTAAAILVASLIVLFKDQHLHFHIHEIMTHTHKHSHDDEHHNHSHDSNEDGSHTHEHSHDPQSHSHPHMPDIHHRHSH